MPTTYKVLGQVVSTASVDTNVYTVPSSTTAIISSIVVVNRGTDGTTFRVAVRPNGATIENKHYVAYGVALAKSSTAVMTIGITCAVSDVISVYSTNGTLSFNLFGAEIEL